MPSQKQTHPTVTSDSSQYNAEPKIAAISAAHLDVEPLKNDLSRTASVNEQAVQQPQLPSKDVAKRKRGIDWNVWQMRTSIRLWEAVALSRNIPPSRLVKTEANNPEKYRNYRTRLKTAKSWLNIDLQILEHPDNGITSEEKMVKFKQFVECAVKHQMKVPPQLLEIIDADEKPSDSSVGAEIKSAIQTSKSLVERNEQLQTAANKMANELRIRLKRIPTRREVSTALSSEEVWTTLSTATIERNIRAKWK